ncbi:hypothetical protein P3C80_30815 [Pseudomonas aeruginosa]|uniref:hypothetical protein n=1 Tax=Pseudomonas aeruginosa TaxID=287 RepID=UPI0021F17766|nr:hypothetical protein [Pseudomonas aeruginosa]MCV6104767.1 hypothetical protein [Pseudomonas aeruginosa]MDI2201435.1 hypothetical protein [Pseudomonas aeruginosa]HBO3958476.1 hypothetical protein [Pseudomonas aeruginosa]HCF6076468.1 hypothetical protein [Pseudomonas aeruginosa]HEP8279084.1 hypothetical protein [Pseudomonas aeruginosa]
MNAKYISPETTFEASLKAIHKMIGRENLAKVISYIAKKHEVVRLKGKGNIENRTHAISIKSSYYKSLLAKALVHNEHSATLSTGSGAHAYNKIYNKAVYKDVEDQISHLAKCMTM